MADALVSTVLEQLSPVILKELRLIVCVNEDVDNLSSKFRQVQAVLKDAEEKQMKCGSVRLWLEDLKDVAYEMEDVLDEWQTKILLKRQQEGVDDAQTSMKKVCISFLFHFCLCFKRVSLGYKIGHQIKKINKRLDDIATNNTYSQLTGSSTSERSEDESERKETSSSLVKESKILGRNKDKEVIIRKLVSESSQQEKAPPVPIISIFGIGGLGKTTLAQFVFNDSQVKGYFQKRIWVCVSEGFDKTRIAKEIIKAVGGENVVNGDSTGWEALHHQLSNSIDGKHFLLVLDDVGTDYSFKWDQLMLSLSCGAKESRIIITTRNQEVAEQMGTTTHRLETLPDADCWSLLSHFAFADSEEEESTKFKDIGMKIARKCKGLPLSAKIIGSHLRSKRTIQQWLHVLQSDTWEISGLEEPILPPLLFIYYDLPSHLKRCFAYCAVFPKDYTISKEALIKMWMAQGFLSTNSAKKDRNLEMVGEEYFNRLAMPCLFHKFNFMGSDIDSFKMHDLVHDFAQFLTKNESFTMEVNSNNNNDQEFNYSRARHLTLVVGKKEINIIPPIYEAESLRTLLVDGRISSISSDLFIHLKRVRVLILSGTDLEELPSEIEKQIHLRYLDLSFTKLKQLPETVINLYNLQALDLYWCRSLRKLPEGIGRMVNLRHVGINGCSELSYLPQGIGKLSSLRTLTDFIVGSDNEDGRGCNIGELKELNLLQGSLQIKGLRRVADGNEAKEADLKNKEYLCHLGLHFHKDRDVALIADDVLDVDDDYSDGSGGNGGSDDDDDDDDDSCGGAAADDDDDDDGGAADDDDDVVDDDDDDSDDDDGGAADDDGEGHTAKRMEDVLESLQPHPYIQKLEIGDYLGTKFPNWMERRDNSMLLSNIVYLDLYNWRKCKQLPLALGKLRFLEKLRLNGMDKVKCMGNEFFGIHGGAAARSDGGVETVFPKLNALEISEMLNLKEWDLRVQQDGKDIIIMPNLHNLAIGDCPKLKVLPSHLLCSTSLTKLAIWDCPILTLDTNAFIFLIKLSYFSKS